MKIEERSQVIDGLRGIAIFMVISWHYVHVGLARTPVEDNIFLIRVIDFVSIFSWSGVDLFFVLSGFLIGGILMDNRNSMSFFKTFYIRRTLRILPLYFIFIFLLYIAIYINMSNFGPGFEWLFRNPFPIWSYVTFTQNFFMSVGKDFGPNWAGVSWSLAIEEQFYLLLPLIVRAVKPRYIPMICIVFIILAPACRMLLYYNFEYIASYVSFPGRMDALFLGVLGAWIIRHASWILTAKYSRSIIMFLSIIFGSGVMIMMIWRLDVTSVSMHMIGFTWIACFYLCIMLWAIDARSKVTRAILSFWPFRAMGIACFSLYLFHRPVNGLISAFWHGFPPKLATPSDLAVLGVSIVTLAAIAWLSWVVIERPCIGYGHRWRY